MVKKVTAKPTLPSVFYRALDKAFAECPTLGKVGTEKTRKMGIFTKKNGKFVLIGRGPHRSAPIHLRLFSRKFHGYAADGTGFEPETSCYAQTSSTNTPHCHLCLDSILVPNILY